MASCSDSMTHINASTALIAELRALRFMTVAVCHATQNWHTSMLTLTGTLTRWVAPRNEYGEWGGTSTCGGVKHETPSLCDKEGIHCALIEYEFQSCWTDEHKCQ